MSRRSRKESLENDSFVHPVNKRCGVCVFCVVCPDFCAKKHKRHEEGRIFCIPPFESAVVEVLLCKCDYVVIFRLIWQNVSGKFEYYADIIGRAGDLTTTGNRTPFFDQIKIHAQCEICPKLSQKFLFFRVPVKIHIVVNN